MFPTLLRKLLVVELVLIAGVAWIYASIVIIHY
jgi:hypothetical protein